MKTLTCRELGGTCDATFSGQALDVILAQAMPHMMSDEAHTASVMDLEKRTGETKDQWMTRMQAEFDARKDD